MSLLLHSVLWEQRDLENRKTLLQPFFFLFSFPLVRVQRVKPVHVQMHTHTVHMQTWNFKRTSARSRTHGALETKDQAFANLGRPTVGVFGGRPRTWLRRSTWSEGCRWQRLGPVPGKPPRRVALLQSTSHRGAGRRRRRGWGGKRQLEEGSFKTPHAELFTQAKSPFRLSKLSQE